MRFQYEIFLEEDLTLVEQLKVEHLPYFVNHPKVNMANIGRCIGSNQKLNQNEIYTYSNV